MTDPSFTVFPAIDLRGGKVVRLAQGDPRRQTAYGGDPAAAARRWLEEGASWLHVIDLDAAFGINGLANRRALEEVLKTAALFGAKVEFGGGIRDEEGIRSALDLGVERVFLGTAAIRDPGLVDWAIAAYGPGRIAGDIGAREGRVVVKGWQEATSLAVLEAGQRFRQRGLEWCVLTDVQRDGAGTGVDVTSAVELQSGTGLHVVASGGVASIEDVRRVREAGLAGVIIGRALYEGKISIRDVVTALAVTRSD